MDFFQRVYYGNTIWMWGAAVLLAFVILLLLLGMKRFFLKRFTEFATKTENDIDDLVADLLGRTSLLSLVILSIFLGSFALDVPPGPARILKTVVVFAVLMQAAIWGSAGISFWIGRYTRHKMDEDAAAVTTVKSLGFLIRILLWVVIILLALDNLGVQISALIAGLGIGGIAIALAAQNILGDLFASLSIVLDRPFVIGDFIIIGEQLGTVEHIGLKTTRIRSLSGEQIIVSNADLLKSRIRNYKRMQERRTSFELGVVYQTPPDKLEAVPGIIKGIIEGLEKTRFDRAHFKEYGDSALKFEVVYYILDPDYNLYMDIQQAINIAIFRRFKADGIEFAYPSRTLFIEGALPAAAPLAAEVTNG